MCEKNGGLLGIYTGTLLSSVIYIHDYLLYLNKYISYICLRAQFHFKKKGVVRFVYIQRTLAHYSLL